MDSEAGVECHAGAKHGRWNGEHDRIVFAVVPPSNVSTYRPSVAFFRAVRLMPAWTTPPAAIEIVTQILGERLIPFGDRVTLGVVGSEVDDPALAAGELREKDEVQAALQVDLLAVLATEH